MLEISSTQPQLILDKDEINCGNKPFLPLSPMKLVRTPPHKNFCPNTVGCDIVRRT